MGSFVMVNQRSNPNRNVNGSMTQSLDILDFGMVHLSWYERLQKRYTKTITAKIKTSKIETEQKTVLNSLAAVEAVVQTLKTRALELRKKDSPFAVPELNRTLAVMPFLGSDMGAGHSKLTSRFGLEVKPLAARKDQPSNSTPMLSDWFIYRPASGASTRKCLMLLLLSRALQTHIMPCTYHEMSLWCPVRLSTSLNDRTIFI